MDNKQSNTVSVKQSFDWNFASVYLQAMTGSAVLMRDKEFENKFYALLDCVERKIMLPDDVADIETYVVHEYKKNRI